MKWRPLTHAPSLVDENGYFHPNVGQQGKPGSGFLGANPSREEIERELRAQIELGRKHIRNLTHLSSHMFGPDTDPLLREVTERLSPRLWSCRCTLRGCGGLAGWAKGRPLRSRRRMRW